MADLVKAFKANLSKNKKNKVNTPFKFKFRSRKDKTQSITILKKHLGKKRGMFADIFRHDKLKGHEKLPEQLEADSTLQ